ncbi:MAG: deoxyribodipyrimidine photo-lyase [Gemmataceae bacterium]
MGERASIVWFRHDLRLEDNPALRAAVDRGGPVVPVFLWSPGEEGAWPPGSASRWWLHQSLQALDAQLRAIGSRLILREGPALAALTALARETDARAVFWNRRYEPGVIDRDRTVKQHLREKGCIVDSFNAALLFEPWQVQNRQGRPYQVYTPFWNAYRAMQPSRPLPAPPHLPPPPVWPHSVDREAFGLEPTIDWAGGLRETWQPGSATGQERLHEFVATRLDSYADGRDRPDEDVTSHLSPYLHFGEVSPRAVWHAVMDRVHERGLSTLPRDAEVFLKELVWREFAFHLLYAFPHTVDQPLRSEFGEFPWRDDVPALRAWQRGRTGYPLVDAGLRQLWHTGWMHNRVRMVAASFLVKHLLLPWQVGARWFWDTLVDADLASNTLGWQWTAGCGADAAPYFRIFNPVSQGEKFDPHGAYVRRWVPELARMPDHLIHRPWAAPAATLAAAGVELGNTYPRPVVDHASARARALQALASLSRSAT